MLRRHASLRDQAFVGLALVAIIEQRLTRVPCRFGMRGSALACVLTGKAGQSADSIRRARNQPATPASIGRGVPASSGR